jgi:hypothetical protein
MIVDSSIGIYIKKDRLLTAYYNILQIISELNTCSAESLLQLSSNTVTGLQILLLNKRCAEEGMISVVS